MTFIVAAIGGLAGAGVIGSGIGAGGLAGALEGAGIGASLGGMINGATSGAGGNGLNSSAPNPGQTAGDIFAAEQTYAGPNYNLTSQYAPQYNQLQQQLLASSTGGLLGGYQYAAPQLQDMQNQLNQSQMGNQVGLAQQYGSQLNQNYLQNNPQLQALQNQYFNMAQNTQNPVGMLGQQGQWGQQFAANAQGVVNNNMVQTPQNQTLNQYQQQAQQQLALGSHMSDQQASTVANQVLSNYNSMGRANDPTAIAGLATGLDTYGQQLLQQREANAAQASGLQTGQNQISLGAQQANLAGQLGGMGLAYEGLYGGSQQNLQGQLSNQQAQLSNANYQSQLLGNASNLAYQTGNQGYGLLQSLLGQQSQGLNGAYGLTNQAGNTVSAGNQLSNMYNPFGSNFNSIYGAQANGNIANANTNAGLISSGFQTLTNPTTINALSGLFGGGGGGGAGAGIGVYG